MSSRILVVDDEESILFALTDYLGLRGFEVDYAGSMEQAQACLAEASYSAVIADLRLAPDNRPAGLELVAEARRSCPSTRTLLLTAYRSPGLDEAARQVGVDRILVKPMPLSEVARVLFELVEGRGD
jgi:DNA-binding response OmpR family regulator